MTGSITWTGHRTGWRGRSLTGIKGGMKCRPLVRELNKLASKLMELNLAVIKKATKPLGRENDNR
ncbi:hypothetical protein LCGC14_2941390, partial [marine sediment metagenome]